MSLKVDNNNFKTDLYEYKERAAAPLSPAQKAIAAPVSLAKPASKSKAAFKRNFLKRIVGSEREVLSKAIEESRNFKLPVESLIACKKGDWSHKFFTQKNWPLQALLSYVQGDLDEMVLSKLFLFDACRNLKDAKAHELVDAEGSRNHENIALLKSGTFAKDFEDSQISELTKLDRTATQFFSFQAPLKKRAEVSAAKTIDLYNLMVHRHPKVPFFTAWNEETRTIRVFVIPPLLQYEINKLKFGECACKPEPVLGYDPDERMDDPDRRIVCVPCRYVKLPEKIHEMIEAADGGMYCHDIYHLNIDSSNPHRKLWIELAREFRLGKLGESLNDRDYSVYALPLDLKPYDRFWYALQRTIRDAPMEKSDRLLKYILNKDREWNSQYGISVAGLRELCEKEPSSTRQSLKPLRDEMEALAVLNGLSV